MENIKITFLGTSNAIPTEKRNHTSILLNFENENVLVDCGEGTQRQLRFAKISPSKLTKILITHWHGDHTLGIPGLLQTLAMSEYQKSLDMYGPRDTKHYMNIINELLNKIKINIKINEVENKVFFDHKKFYMETLSMKHDCPTNAYSIILKDKIRLDKKKIKKLKLPNSPLLGELQQGKNIKLNGKTIKAKDVTYLEKGKKLTIILDTAYTENAIKLAKNADLLIIESSFSKEDKAQAKEYLHLTAEEAATIAKKANVKKLILTHISQRYEHNPSIIEKEAKKIFKNTVIAKDLDIFKI